jgi:predicted O-linked N-acetylglucosamine transferase (SPINDLY family)
MTTIGRNFKRQGRFDQAADLYDALIAIPEQQFKFYGEQLVWLPDTFIPNDEKRLIAKETPAPLRIKERAGNFAVGRIAQSRQ